ncbi:MAG: ATP synthase F1 subunit gamma [Bacteroidales bacterium]|nr:ATP synthase F1 subunit gamma [Bacteroidales bacterium]
MASLREIKNRIASVKSTLKITSAMKMVASAKLHKAQTAIGNKIPYEQKLHRMLSGMLQDDDLQMALQKELGFGAGSRSPIELQDTPLDFLPEKESVSRVAVVVFSSNSSLIGAFNANVIKKFSETMRSLSANGYSRGDIDIYTVGRKVAEAVRRDGHASFKDLPELSDKPDYAKASSLASELVERFANGEVGQVVLIYNHFASMSSQPSVRENYLPMALHDYNETSEPVDYILEPDPLALVRELLPLVLTLKIYTVALDASAAEHAARTLAMQVASDNAKDLISELTLAYNKGRQQEITAEILDLVGGLQN